MRVRLARASDVDDVVAMARHNAETVPHRTFNETRTRATFADYLRTAFPVFFIAEASTGETCGMLVASATPHRAFDGLYTSQEVLYVKPAWRGSRAAVYLMREMDRWSRILGATEIIGGADNEADTERTARFLARLGFKRVGIAMRKELPHGQ